MSVNKTDCRDIQKKRGGLVFSIVLLILLIPASLVLGAEKIPLSTFFNPQRAGKFAQIIIFNIRLPRTILAVLAGALLSGSGVILQGFFRNGLADSGIMGISAGATLGAVLSGFLPVMGGAAAVFSLGHFVSPVALCAFCGSLLTGMAIYLIAGSRHGSSTVTILLSGTALGTFFSALTSVILLLRDKELHKLYTWNLGSFNAKGWSDVVFVLTPAIISFFLFFICSRPLDLLSDGEQTAESLGVEMNRMKMTVLCASSLATAAAVCAGGTIGFVGLIAPHICRRIFGPSHRFLLITSMITGAGMLLFCDIISRTIAAPAEIPVGIITSIAGAPFFLYVMTKETNYGS